jgi:hypothetical protein
MDRSYLDINSFYRVSSHRERIIFEDIDIEQERRVLRIITQLLHL